jgi:tetratricopeptide (TPR) repeat protein
MKKFNFSLLFSLFLLFSGDISAQSTDKENLYKFLGKEFGEVLLYSFKPGQISGSSYYGNDDFSRWMNQCREKQSDNQYCHTVYLIFQLKGLNTQDNNEINDVKKNIESFSQKYPDFFWSKYLQAAFWYKTQQDDLLDREIAEIHQWNPQDACSYLLTAIYTKDNQLARALYDKVVSLDPDFADAHYYYGSFLADMEEYQKATEHLEKAYQLNSKHIGILSELGSVYSKQKQYNRALEMYEKAIQQEPNEVELYVAKSIIEFNMGDFSKSMATAKKAIELKPEYYKGHMVLGLAQIYARKYKDGCKNLYKAKTIASYLENKTEVEEVESYLNEYCKK